ncbi:MAG: twin-arginine translocase TatA/TatE family subunit [Bdellovibrionales bacterium]|jgi:sec-independent protein translocase protein TatB|nr:twin-arginine translocase TatA/TatE family subunit [Bdellovibrionales bacterium]
MFDIGFGEMIVLAAIALIAIGPKELPAVARAVGRLIGEFKRTVGDVTTTVAQARNEADQAIRKVTDGLNESLRIPPESLPVEPLKPHRGDVLSETGEVLEYAEHHAPEPLPEVATPAVDADAAKTDDGGKKS